MNQFESDKILKHLDRVHEWRIKGLSRPITYELDMTNLCNSECPFCFGFSGEKGTGSSLSLGEAIDVIRQIKGFGGKGLTFTGGGDPLCNSSTLDAVVYAAKIGLDVGFITNGISLNKRAAEVLVQNCTWVRISLDAGNRAFYEITHGRNGHTFDNVVKNIRMLVSAKKKKYSGTTIGVGFITSKATAGDMEGFTKLCKGLGVDYAQFRPLLRKHGEIEVNRGASPRILSNIKKCLRYSDEKFKVLCSVHKYESIEKGNVERGYGKCHGHNFAAVISANMKMYLCCHMRGLEKYCLGDLRRSSLRNIWRSRRRRDVMNKIDFGDCPLLCRCDGFNNILWNISKKAEHVNFL